MSMTNEQIQAPKEQAECVCGILENIAGYEPDDIDGDDVDIRFETEDGFDTGCTVSIVEQCQSAADVIRSLLAERDADKALIAEQAKRIAELESQRQMAFMACNRWADKFREAEAKIDARTVTVKLPDSIPCPTAPEIIWLQTNGDDSDESKWPESDDDVSWCREKIFTNDTLYVRADLVVAGITFVVGE
ncbi:hypothetical protein R0H17_15805 [Phytobacter diazotrophicus]|uniref:hypothetical protein n=1 Tax=Phytobacter diazotrophicus TaxID=395631 RepID=UPI00293699FE|nr:hypothetical protein [Phytobacter diazotrophicus]MDV2903104.1 hypothetical protein [Phytobacter diazotrophicus]